MHIVRYALKRRLLKMRWMGENFKFARHFGLNTRFGIIWNNAKQSIRDKIAFSIFNLHGLSFKGVVFLHHHKHKEDHQKDVRVWIRILCRATFRSHVEPVFERGKTICYLRHFCCPVLVGTDIGIDLVDMLLKLFKLRGRSFYNRLLVGGSVCQKNIKIVKKA